MSKIIIQYFSFFSKDPNDRFSTKELLEKIESIQKIYPFSLKDLEEFFEFL